MPGVDSFQGKWRNKDGILHEVTGLVVTCVDTGEQSQLDCPTGNVVMLMGVAALPKTEEGVLRWGDGDVWTRDPEEEKKRNSPVRVIPREVAPTHVVGSSANQPPSGELSSPRRYYIDFRSKYTPAQGSIIAEEREAERFRDGHTVDNHRYVVRKDCRVWDNQNSPTRQNRNPNPYRE
eukprot:TRINITY_DN22722_c0_g1_i1.p1 TRINITY_DN22722_c0_g1~~TRINITY_DN22722_c0_g1_i1.p1  ORF type:complete len:178 (+),score=24.40 TRINITY_DN22722_c0_g1_i1:37-570(+)